MTRAEKKVARRRYRLEKRGSSRTHWERRRRGTRNSAPQLRHRGAMEESYCDVLLTGEPRPRGRVAHQDEDMHTLFKGILSNPVRDSLMLIAYNNSNRAAAREREQAARDAAKR